MKTQNIRNALAVAAVGAGMALAMSAPAQAALVYKNVTSVNPMVGSSAEQDFLNMLDAGYVTESFESYALGDAEFGAVPGPFSTNVGSFEGTGVGDLTGSCVSPCNRLQILDADSTPFNGRFAVEMGGTVDTKDATTGDTTGQWLDSNDISKVTWTLDTIDSDYNAFGFYLMDGADQGATLEVTFADGSSDVLSTLDNESNGGLFYMAGISMKAILGATVTFENVAGNNAGDGFGIDRVTVGKAEVPAPATLGLLGAGLVGLGMAARRRHHRA